MGNPELAVGCLVGNLAVSLAVGGAACLLAKVKVSRSLWGPSLFLWLALGGLWLLGGNGRLSVFECLALGVVFLIFICYSKPQVKVTKASWRLLGGVVWLVVGAWLVVAQSAPAAAVLSWPLGVLATVVITPCLCLPALVTAVKLLRQGQGELVVRSLGQAGVANATGLVGLVGLVAGGLTLSWRTVTLSLPFVGIASLLGWLPLLSHQKSPKIWGVLLVGLYLFYLISLAW